MNIYTAQIATLLKITPAQALEVKSQMEGNGVDFSECSKTQFNREAKLAAKEIGVTK